MTETHKQILDQWVEGVVGARNITIPLTVDAAKEVRSELYYLLMGATLDNPCLLQFYHTLTAALKAKGETVGNP